MTDTNTLAPCPFCGERAETDFIPEHHSYAIECSDSMGCTARVIQETEQAAIDAWNRRAPAPASQPFVVPAGMEPVAWLIVRSAFSASPDGQDAESSEWLEQAHEPGESGSFAVYTAAQVQAMLAQGVAPGWQAVPVEPDEAMIDALAGPGRVLPAYVGAKEKSDARLAGRWSDALAAAPSRLARKPMEMVAIYKLLESIGGDIYDRASACKVIEFARAIEAAHGITAAHCWCQTCRPITIADCRMVLCPDCGNKRCPKANDHRHACTGSNLPGQAGSAYPAHGTPAAQKGGRP